MAGLYDLLPSVRQQFANGLGVPYALGKMYFYATGTTTAQNVYADSPPTTVLNDVNGLVTLDANGRLPAVYLQPLAYKIVLKDAADVEVFTQDPVVGSDLAKFAAYKAAAASASATGLTSEQDITGATVSLDRNGIWKVTATFDIQIAATANAATVTGYLNVDGSNEVGNAVFAIATTGQTVRATLFQQWTITITAQPKTVKLRAARTSGTGTCDVFLTNTKIVAEYLGAT